MFEDELKKLIDEGEKYIDVNYKGPGVGIETKEWLNDVEIFCKRELIDHPLFNKIDSALFHKENKVCIDVLSYLKSVNKDNSFKNEKNGIGTVIIDKWKAKEIPKYDVFISHANKDKDDLIEELFQSLDKLGVDIFYDKESIDWGDKWKEKILEGTKKSEFAIIVISENFFGREWTEKELTEFLNRQNRNGQKLILPILHNISKQQLEEQYPSVADIQAIDSNDYSCDQVALLFAKQLIKRLKAVE